MDGRCGRRRGPWSIEATCWRKTYRGWRQGQHGVLTCFAQSIVRAHISATATCAPARANARAMPLPMPCAPPVTTTTLSRTSMPFLLCAGTMYRISCDELELVENTHQVSWLWMKSSGCTVLSSRAATAAIVFTVSFEPVTARGCLARRRVANWRATSRS